MKIAKEIFEMKLNDILRVKNKGNYKIGIEFGNYKSANLLVANRRLLVKGYIIYIPFNMVTCKAIIRRVDPDLNIGEI